MTRILLLDECGDLLLPLLKEAGYEALATANPHEALLILRTQPVDLLALALGSRTHEPSPALRLLLPEIAREMQAMAYKNPAMTGEEFLRLIKDDEDLRSLPVLLLTGFDRAVCVKFFREFGLDIDRDVDGYVQKGGRRCFEELFNGIEAVLKKHGKPTPPEHLRNRILERSRHRKARQRTAPGRPVTVEFTGQEWADLSLAYRQTFSRSEWLELRQSARVEGTGWQAQWSLDEIKSVKADLRIAADLTDDPKLEARFRGLFDKLRQILDQNDDRNRRVSSQ